MCVYPFTNIFSPWIFFFPYKQMNARTQTHIPNQLKIKSERKQKQKQKQEVKCK